MEYPLYQVYYGFPKEIKEEVKLTQHACFAWLRSLKNERYVKVGFKNRADNFFKKPVTKKWIEEVLNALDGLKVKEAIKDIEIREDKYFVTLDLHLLSYEWALSLLTLFRYPGEFYNICYNYYKIKEVLPEGNFWILLCLAHKGSFVKEYDKTFEDNSFSYNYGHTIFTPGIRECSCNFEKAISSLDDKEVSPKNWTFNSIHPIWNGVYSIGKYENFDYLSVKELYEKLSSRK